jgi:hypothetical protein
LDRKIVYPGSVPLETDVLWTNRFAMIGMGYLAQDLLGSATQVFGAAVSPGSGLNVSVAPGRIYSVQPVEATQYSSLPADLTDTVLKQGLLFQAATIPVNTVTLSAGQSVNYLIEGQYQDVDGDNATLAYFNASNPQMPFSGAGGNGLAQPTTRRGFFAVQAKGGTAATTGSQTTPAVDSGWTPMYVVTVAFGASSITTGNISPHPSLPQNSGFFNMTYVGGTTAPSALAAYSTNGPIVALTWPAIAGVTSNSSQFSYSGIPNFLMPSAGSALIQQSAMAVGFSGSTVVQVEAAINGGTPNALTFINPLGWNVGGFKSMNSGTIVYSRGF